MFVREFNEKDIESIFWINKECFKRPQPSPDVLTAIDKGKCWVYQEDYIVGFIIGQPVNGAVLHTVAVLKDFRKLGIASELIKQFEEFYKGRRLWLTVNADNSAQKLYFDCGYRICDILKDYYFPDQHALVMEKFPHLSRITGDAPEFA